MERREEMVAGSINSAAGSVSAELVRSTIELTQAGLSHIDTTDRQAVIIMGSTGAGKSTLINLLAGVRLIAVYEQATGVMRIDAPNPLPDFRIGHRVASETAIPHKWRSPEGVVYWDCPGFVDNRGVAQQIANATFVKKLFDTPQVKILIVVKESDILDPRATPVIALVRQLESLFVGNVEQIQGAVSLVVSHASSRREPHHIQASIGRIVREVPGLSSGQSLLLTYLMHNPISVLRTPLVEWDIPVTVVDVVVQNVSEVQYGNNLQVGIALSEQAKLVALASYNELNMVMERSVRQFADDFGTCVNNFAVACQEQPQLQPQLQVIVTELNLILQHEYSVQQMPAVAEGCRTVARICGADLQSTDLDNALAKIELITFLEQFVDERSQIPLQVVRSIRDKIADTRVIVEKAVIDIAVTEAVRQAEVAEAGRIAAIERADTAATAAVAAEQRAANAEAEVSSARESLDTVTARVAEMQIILTEQERARVAAEERARLEQARADAEMQKRLDEQKKLTAALQKAQQETQKAIALQREIAARAEDSDSGCGGSSCRMM